MSCWPGILLGASFAPLLGALLHGVRPADPLTFVAVSAVLLIVGATASFLPALRATRVDPAVTLRAD